MTRSCLNQMPAHTFASDAKALTIQPEIIKVRELVVCSGGDQINTLARAPTKSRTLETTSEETLEKGLPWDGFR